MYTASYNTSLFLFMIGAHHKKVFPFHESAKTGLKRSHGVGPFIKNEI